jgi:hypothetical protein
MTFKPFPSPDRWYGPLAILGLLGLDVVAVREVLARPVDGVSFLLTLWLLGSLLVVGYVGYRTLGAFTLQYWVDRDGVTLIWGPTRQIVPMAAIRRIQRGVAAGPRNRGRPWHWPCRHRRRLACADLPVLNSYATRPPAGQLILVTDDECYGLSPAEPERFLAALQARYALGPARPLKIELRRPPFWTWALWQDRTAQLLIGLGLLGVLLMFGYLSFRFPTLSADLPLHFDVAGIPDRIAPKSGLFALPIIGLVTWFFNLAAGILMYRRVQPQGAYLLWGGALVVQGIAGLALFNLMRW